MRPNRGTHCIAYSAVYLEIIVYESIKVVWSLHKKDIAVKIIDYEHKARTSAINLHVDGNFGIRYHSNIHHLIVKHRNGVLP